LHGTTTFLPERSLEQLHHFSIAKGRQARLFRVVYLKVIINRLAIGKSTYSERFGIDNTELALRDWAARKLTEQAIKLLDGRHPLAPPESRLI